MAYFIRCILYYSTYTRGYETNLEAISISQGVKEEDYNEWRRRIGFGGWNGIRKTEGTILNSIKSMIPPDITSQSNDM